MQPDEVRQAIEFLLSGQSDEGVIPDRVTPDARPVVRGWAGRRADWPATIWTTPSSSCWQPRDYLAACDPAEAESTFRSWARALERGMDTIPLTARGLVGNNPLDPHSPYGFTDTIGKTGELFMESLLFWEASTALADMHDRWGSAEAAISHRKRASCSERNIDVLWSEADGMFYAATADCRQIDVWGNAYALYIGFPLGDKRVQILDYLTSRYEDYAYRGQIRHVPKGEHWQRLLKDVAPERYQNGAYWATPSGWVLWCLAQRDESLAKRVLQDLLEDFRARPHL